LTIPPGIVFFFYLVSRYIPVYRPAGAHSIERRRVPFLARKPKISCFGMNIRYNCIMFDIREYYGDVHDGGSVPMEQCPAEIEEDISTDIEKLLRSRFDSLYARDRFRNGQASVEILHPRHPYQGNRTLLKGPDHMRYLLSLYPRKSDLDNLKMLQRRHHSEASRRRTRAEISSRTAR